MSAVIYHGPQPPSQNGYELLAAHAIKLQHELMRALKAECERDEAMKQLRIAVGLLSTQPQFADKHPEDVLAFVKDASK